MYVYAIDTKNKNIFIDKVSIKEAEKKYGVSNRTILKYKRQGKVYKDVYYFSDSLLNKENLSLVFGDIKDIITDREEIEKREVLSDSEDDLSGLTEETEYGKVSNTINESAHSTINIKNSIPVHNTVHRLVHSVINIDNIRNDKELSDE